ncbi:MAG TPA: DNA adenine methylase, partial [Sinorhizobium sp.]|nr:DNA adenine methylase [Sinorhizobium sp.]
MSVGTWEEAKRVFAAKGLQDELELGFATFFLNRTNRSGILNGGMIGGKAQTGPWKIDARFNKAELVERIERIAALKNRIKLTNLDAVDFLDSRSPHWGNKTLVYLDPPYFVKGGQLYYDFYSHADHATIS